LPTILQELCISSDSEHFATALLIPVALRCLRVLQLLQTSAVRLLPSRFDDLLKPVEFG